MSVKIRLKRFGTKMRPFYRIVVMDSRMARDSRTIEEIGLYHPIETGDKQLVIDEARAKDWLSRGAQPSDTVRSLLNKKNIHVKSGRTETAPAAPPPAAPPPVETESDEGGVEQA